MMSTTKKADHLFILGYLDNCFITENCFNKIISALHTFKSSDGISQSILGIF